jgi:hypothetical protein
MKKLESKRIQTTDRYFQQNAATAIRDLYDALIELITNADDRYQFLEEEKQEQADHGEIRIVYEKPRGAKTATVKITDFADGMTAEDMDEKLGIRGGRVSGLEQGRSVRGTNSRGAKDIAGFGTVQYQSIKDEQFHQCELKQVTMQPYESEAVTPEIRKTLGIPKGTGTVVTLTPFTSHRRIPSYAKLVEELPKLVALRDILKNPKRRIMLSEAGTLTPGTSREVRPPTVVGTDVHKETIPIPGYENITAKLIVTRAKTQFPSNEKERFRMGGILVKSRHAIHEATLFDKQLDHDEHARWFYGKLTCNHIDALWNEWDECTSDGMDPPENNPRPIYDPQRRTGCDRQHPFVKALFTECRKRLRGLVEKERQQAVRDQKTIESKKTRERLDQLERAVTKFMDNDRDEDESITDPTAPSISRTLREKGYAITPPYHAFVVGETRLGSLTVRQEAFPGIELGAPVQLECQTEAISLKQTTVGLEAHPTETGLLKATWQIRAEKETPATALTVRCEKLSGESTFEVFATEQDKYAHYRNLCFSSQRYGITADGRRKRITLYCPLTIAPKSVPLDITISDKKIEIRGERKLIPDKKKGIAICTFHISATAPTVAKIKATFEHQTAEATIASVEPKGAGYKIEFSPDDLGNARSKWSGNILYIAAKHPSLRRYLGKEPNYPGQESLQYRVLLAEVVAEAVCAQKVARREQKGEYEDDEKDWDNYFNWYSALMRQFLLLAHETQVPDSEI